MNVPLFEFGPWACTYEAASGFLFQGPSTIGVRFGDYPGQLFVERNVIARMFRLRPKAYGPPSYYGDQGGGIQGGGDIDLRPKWTRKTRAQMDGTIRRHAIGFFDVAGNPRAPWPTERYPLSARPHPDGYQDIDGPHYVRAFEHAVAMWTKERDPVARMWLILCAHHVMRRFPLVKFTDGDGPSEYSLAAMWDNVNATPHYGALGIQRENGHCLRAVVEAQRAAPSQMFEDWITRFVDVLYMGQCENGATERHRFGEGLAQEEDDVRSLGMQPGEEWCTSWQAPYTVVAVGEAMKVVPACRAHGYTVLQRMRKLWNVAKVTGDVYDGVATPSGIPRYLVVAEDGRAVDTITRGYGPARTTWDGDAFITFRENGLA